MIIGSVPKVTRFEKPAAGVVRVSLVASPWPSMTVRSWVIPVGDNTSAVIVLLAATPVRRRSSKVARPAVATFSVVPVKVVAELR